jgi:hypothetical protein
MDFLRTRRTLAALATLIVASGVSLWLAKLRISQVNKAPSVASIEITPGDSDQTKAIVEIEVSDHPAVSADASGQHFTFRVVADDQLPETNGKSVLQVSTMPYLPYRKDGPAQTSIPGRSEWTFTAQVLGDDINLVKLRASICESSKCTGKLDKTRERIVDVGPSAFDDYAVVIHPTQLTAGRAESQAFIDIQKQSHVVTPTSTIKLHVAARDECVSFQPDTKVIPYEPSIDLVIDSSKKKSQTEYFRIQPATLPPDTCAIDVAVYDDEKQRPSPKPPELSFKLNPWTAVWMSLLGSAVALLFLVLWRRRRHEHPIISWSDPFEQLAKGFLAVLLGLVLTKTDFIGITIDKTSANGFFTTGFFLGFIPLDTVFMRILKALGLDPPAPAGPGSQKQPPETRGAVPS